MKVSFNRSLILWANQCIWWLAQHWLALFNGFFALYVGLAFMAPVLLAYGYTSIANMIYAVYRLDCHQLPSRSYFIAGEQVAFCHRHVAMYGTLLVGGLVFNIVRSRLKPPALRWAVFFLVPIAVDGGLGLASEWLHFMPISMLWAIGLIAMGITSAILHSRRYLTWHSYLFFAAGPLSLIYLQYFGPYQSNWSLRTITGIIFGLGTVWYGYLHLEAYFGQVRHRVNLKLGRASLT
ncbi:MAG: hypothetical protein DPW09_01575 [Anaerolineae bacterium]|nr:hypothetical protein [Anaerolineae bacterium]